MKKTTKPLARLIAATAVVGVVALGAASPAAAEGDYDKKAESYPPAPHPTPKMPAAAKPLPATGSDGTGLWLRAGGGALLAGGLLVAASSRRRQQVAEA